MTIMHHTAAGVTAFGLCLVCMAPFTAQQAQPVVPATPAATGRPAPVSAKEAAFREYYQKDPACDSFRDDNAMDRCRYAYMKAKQEFEKIWAERQKQARESAAE